MKFFRSCILAFYYYTRIPMPQISFQEHDGDYLFCFFPLIGLLAGVLELLWFRLSAAAGFGTILTSVISVVIPVLLTGGIHLDGFLDTVDAMASWKSREERLKIMHDPHAGAFAVIFCGIYLLTVFGAASELFQRNPAAACLIFCTGRMFTALLVVHENPAGKQGMLYSVTQSALKRAVLFSTAVYLAAMTALSFAGGFLTAWLVETACALVFLLLYRIWIRRVFGGISGDLAGCYLTLCELIMLFAALFCG